jgi:hypothetical protein
MFIPEGRGIAGMYNLQLYAQYGAIGSTADRVRQVTAPRLGLVYNRGVGEQDRVTEG